MAEVIQRIDLDVAKVRNIYLDPKFQMFRRMRMRFMLTATLIGLTFNLGLPILSVFTHLLDIKAFGEISWGWVYAFSQFIFAPLLLHVHLAHMHRADAIAAKLRAAFDVKE